MKAIEIEHVSVSYGEITALTDITFSVEEFEYLGIMGPNGGGKSTLLKAILGFVPIREGTIKIYGQPITYGNGFVGYVPQFSKIDRTFPISVGQVALSGRLIGKRPFFYHYSKEDKKVTRQVLDQVGIGDLANRQINDLSGGEFQKLLIARALVTKPKILFLDEPTSNVDSKSTNEIYKLLSELNKATTIIMVTHDLAAVSSDVQQLACLNGNLVYHGEPQLKQDVVDQLYGCPVDLIAHGVAHRVLGIHKGGNVR